ncbi:DNA repair protein RecO [Ulvibacter antarcticus]|uniref:DNA repair protein RecO n=1 Tax=Ulvibacter antarcticus TaxID=442714 RepID=A0A3L9Z6X0_9FLAO|nr:DNA repair protein RecO [Ulvibacter antarcticus]RMA66158.1 DNA replication and repair protein RecO [Ulvibacter antarcticus]
MLVSTNAIVFSSLKYSEADLIVSCFTETDGIKSYLLRGILKSRKGKLKSSFFQPLTQLELIAFHKNKGTLESIREAKVINPYQSLHTDIVKTGMVMFLSEMLKNCIKEEEKNELLYEYLEHAFYWLDQHDEIANFHILFLLKLSSHLGFYPDASDIETEYFNLLEGCFQKIETNNYCQNGSTIQFFKRFFGINFDGISSIKLTKKERLEVLNLLLTYYQLHLQGYKKPKSLLVLNQLFQ